MPLMINGEVTHLQVGDLLIFDILGKLKIRRGDRLLNFKLDCGCLDDYFLTGKNFDHRKVAELLALVSGFSSVVESWASHNEVWYELVC